MAATRSDPGNCWVFPLKKDEAPALKQIDNPKIYLANDELVIPVAILETFKAASSTHKAGLTYEHLRDANRRGNAKVIVKKMDEPFGQGAFAGEQGFVKGNIVVYSGVYAERMGYAGSSCTEQIYLIALTPELFVDAKNSVNKARYFQHLQDDDDPMDVGYAATLDETVAMENVMHQTFYFSINLQACDYIIPVSVLVAKRYIHPNEIIGYSYGKEYWYRHGVTPTLFNQLGTPIKFITLQMINEEYKIKLYGINKAKANKFQQERYLKYNSENLLILPPDVTVIPEGAANGVYLPALYTVSSKNTKGFIIFYMNENMIFFDLHSVDTLSLLQLILYMKELGYKCGYAQVDGKLRFMLSIKDLAKLTVTKAEEVFARLNAAGDCQFSVDVSTQYRQKITAVSNAPHSSFFAPVNAVQQDAEEDEKKPQQSGMRMQI